jgi:hypothetical protein
VNPITWTFPHGSPSEGRITRFAGAAYDEHIQVEIVGSPPDGWCALMYRRGSPVPVVTLSMAGPSVQPLQRAMQVAAERLMREEGWTGVIEDVDNVRAAVALGLLSVDGKVAP